MTTKTSNITGKPATATRSRVPSMQLGLARYLACRELSLLVREDENMCPVPTHPGVTLNANLTEQCSKVQAENTITQAHSNESATAQFCALRRHNTGLSLTDNESDSEFADDSGSYWSLPLCLEESHESSQNESSAQRKEQSKTLSTEESKIIQRSRLGSIEEKVEQVFKSKSEEEILKSRAEILRSKQLSLENKYSKSLAQICGQIPMSDSAYGYALLLFKSVMVRVDAAMSCTQPERQSPQAIALVKTLNTNPTLFRDTEKLFKVCIYEGYKIVEDEYALYLEDFAKVAGIAKDELEALELFVIRDVMDFRMIQLFAFDEQVSEEVKVLQRISAEQAIQAESHRAPTPRTGRAASGLTSAPK